MPGRIREKKPSDIVVSELQNNPRHDDPAEEIESDKKSNPNAHTRSARGEINNIYVSSPGHTNSQQTNQPASEVQPRFLPYPRRSWQIKHRRIIDTITRLIGRFLLEILIMIYGGTLTLAIQDIRTWRVQWHGPTNPQRPTPPKRVMNGIQLSRERIMDSSLNSLHVAIGIQNAKYFLGHSLIRPLAVSTGDPQRQKRKK